MRSLSFKVEFSIRLQGEGDGRGAYGGRSYLFYVRLSFLLVAMMMLVYHLVTH